MVKIRKILKTSYVALWKSDISDKQELRKKCLYLELFWSAISVFGLNTKRYGIRNISLYSVRMRENTGQNNYEYKHFSRSEDFEK